MKNRLGLKYFVFLDNLEKIIESRILKLKFINIIIESKKNNKPKDFLKTVNFCKKNKIPFYFTDNYQLCTKHSANGIFLNANNKSLIKPLSLKKKFKIIGKAHNQLEYFIKANQSCSLIMLSPLFYNNKYTINKILNPLKFNLTSKDWKIKISALGGINESNLRKVFLTKTTTVGVKKYLQS
jgi:thiamine-phosphate pyrophosphorylase